ncbi:MAG: dTMP kinase [Candidatus Shapirobacteria bacterium]|jgi:dTMP kinase|nr:dTMP kinase [Candidatus Shapirobacteria bacterium]
MNKKGKFIVFEGIDGCGKGTQIEKLQNYFEQNGIKTIVTCEHTRNLPVGKLIEVTLNGGEKMDPLALQLCFVADRRDHYKKVIEPAIENDEFVISDRYYGSTVAYTEEEKKQMMLELNENVVPRADLTIFLDIDAETAIKRIDEGRSTKTIFERKEKLEQCRRSYLWFCEKMGDDVVVIDGNRDMDIIHKDILEKLKNKKII